MYLHHAESIEKLKEYFSGKPGVIAIVLDGSVVKGNARPDSDIDAVVVVTEEEYRRLNESGRLAEVIHGQCTYEGGYFDIKYKTKAMLREAALHASEPTRNAFVKAQTVYSADGEIPGLVEQIACYPERDLEEKIKCFTANLNLNRMYFLHIVGEDNVYMRAHLAQQIVYSVYRLILAENRVLFPCHRRLEEAVRSCKRRPEDIVDLGAKFLRCINEDNCNTFVSAFWRQSKLPLFDGVDESCSLYVKYYEDWWRREDAPFPDEW